MSDGEIAYLTLRHFSPEAVRNLRAGFDVGSTADELKRLALPFFAERLRVRVAAAIDYMAATPTAGVVVWHGQEYDWQDSQ